LFLLELCKLLLQLVGLKLQVDETLLFLLACLTFRLSSSALPQLGRCQGLVPCSILAVLPV
jgi:hypothetical protein